MKTIQIISSIILLIGLIGCNCDYKVTKTEIKSNCEMWGLSISKIEVDSFDREGIPRDYKIGNTINARQKGDHKFTDRELDAMKDVEEFDPDKYGYDWKPQKKIKFNKENKYFFWSTDNPYREYEACPIEFERNQWYLIRRFQDASMGGGTYYIFVYVDELEELKQINYFRPGPF